MNWIVRMLKQIRTGLADQAVGVLGFVIFLRGVRYRFFRVYLSISVFFLIDLYLLWAPNSILRLRPTGPQLIEWLLIG